MIQITLQITRTIQVALRIALRVALPSRLPVPSRFPSRFPSALPTGLLSRLPSGLPSGLSLGITLGIALRITLRRPALGVPPSAGHFHCYTEPKVDAPHYYTNDVHFCTRANTGGGIRMLGHVVTMSDHFRGLARRGMGIRSCCVPNI